MEANLPFLATHLPLYLYHHVAKKFWYFLQASYEIRNYFGKIHLLQFSKPPILSKKTPLERH